MLNIDRYLNPSYIVYVKKFRIKFFKKQIVFNPGEKLAKKILELAEKTKLNKINSNINKKIKNEEAKIIVYCNIVYSNWIKNSKKKQE